MKTLHKLITGLSKYIILSSVIKRWRYLGPNSRVCISCLFVFDLGKKKSLFLGISFIYKTHVKETWLEWQRLSVFEMKACGRWLLDWQVSFTLSIWQGGTQSVMEKRFSIFSHFFHFFLLAGEKERHWNTCGGRIGRRGQWENWNICSVKVNCSFRHTRGIGVGDCGSGYEGEMQKGVYVWVQLILSKHGNCVH